MESMTGYGFIEKNTEQFSFSAELKTLNSRYLEIFITLPKVLRNDENEIHGILKEHFTRGKLELSVDIHDWVGARAVSLNDELVVKYYQELQKIHKRLNITEPVDMGAILTLDGITQRERSAISEKSRNDVYNAVRGVIKKATAMRVREGEALKKDLSNSVREISGLVENIRNLSRNQVKEKMDNLSRRLSDLSEGIVEERIYMELAVMSDKLDINEEIIRMKDHLVKFRSIMKEQGQVGRKLDFLAQELFREINTIASKSNSSEISHLTVDVKNNIDKIREQCRNIV